VPGFLFDSRMDDLEEALTWALASPTLAIMTSLAATGAAMTLVS
jgi:hypothetical protein